MFSNLAAHAPSCGTLEAHRTGFLAGRQCQL